MYHSTNIMGIDGLCCSSFFPTFGTFFTVDHSHDVLSVVFPHLRHHSFFRNFDVISEGCDFLEALMNVLQSLFPM